MSTAAAAGSCGRASASTTTFTGDVDLSGGLEGFGDPALRQRVGDVVPFDIEGLRRKLGSALNEVFKIQVVAALPGSVSSNAPGKASNGAVWHPKLGERV